MGRGLSDLQLHCLALAKDRPIFDCVIYFTFFHQWPRCIEDNFPWGERINDATAISAIDEEIGCVGYVFGKKWLGESVYRSVRVSVSRALSRLEQRGLITRGYYHVVRWDEEGKHGRRGYEITPEGVSIVKNLTADDYKRIEESIEATKFYGSDEDD